MAIIHLSEAKAARDLAGLLAKVRAGEKVRIDSGSDTFSIVTAEQAPPKPRLLSEIVAALEARGSTAKLPPGFAAHAEDGIRSHEHERLIDPWESF